MDYYLTDATYQVEYRLTGRTVWEPWTTNLREPYIDISPLTVDTLYDFRVRAWTPNNVPGHWTEINGVLTAADAEAPPRPQLRAEDVTTWLRTITVRWSGKGINATGDVVDMSSDFDHINVYQADNPNMVNAVHVGTLFGPHEPHQTDTMPADIEVWYALTSVDRSGNESEFSDVHSTIPKANVDVGEIANKLDAANVLLQNINAEESLLAGTVVAYHITASESLTAKVAQFLTIEAGMIAANAVTSDTIAAGAISAGHISANAITSDKISASAITSKHTITGATIQTSSLTNRGIKLVTDGIKVWSKGTTYGSPFAAGTFTYLLDENTGRVDMRDRLVVGGSRWLSADSPGVAIIPYGVASGDNTTTGAGVFINKEASTASNSAGMWVNDPNTTAARPLTIRGYQGGEVEMASTLALNFTLTNAARSIWINTNAGGSADDIDLLAGGAVIARGVRGGFRMDGISSGTSGSEVRVIRSSDVWVFSLYSSSVSTKDAIETLPSDYSEKLLSLEPRWYFDKYNAEEYAAYLEARANGEHFDETRFNDIQPIRRSPGLIAEEAHDAGLTPWVNYDLDEETGEQRPRDLSYSNMWVPLIPVVRENRDKTREHDQKIADLEAQVKYLSELIGAGASSGPMNKRKS